MHVDVRSVQEDPFEELLEPQSGDDELAELFSLPAQARRQDTHDDPGAWPTHNYNDAYRDLARIRPPITRAARVAAMRRDTDLWEVDEPFAESVRAEAATEPSTHQASPWPRPAPPAAWLENLGATPLRSQAVTEARLLDVARGREPGPALTLLDSSMTLHARRRDGRPPLDATVAEDAGPSSRVLRRAAAAALGLIAAAGLWQLALAW